MWQIVINGPAYLDSTVFLPEGMTTLGRAPESDIVLTGNSVSRAHAQLEVKSESLYIVDLGSRNGSQVNGRPLKGTALVRAGDVISLGEFTLTVRQPAKVENIFATEVSPAAGGVKRVGAEQVAEPELVGIKRVGSSRLLKALEFPAAPDDNDTGLPPAYRTLLLLQESSDRVNSAATLQAFLDETLEWLRQRVGADAAAILLRHTSGALVPVAVWQEGLAKGEVPVVDAALDAATQRRAAIAIRDPGDEGSGPRKKAKTESARHILCAPIGGAGKIGGALHIRRMPRKEEDVDLLLDVVVAVAHLVGQGVERFLKDERGRRNERLKKTLQRFHSPDIIERRIQDISRSGREQLTQMEERTLTVLVADMSNFTQRTKTLKPNRVVDLLNDFYSHMTRIIFSFEGTVDKFMGDAVLALFGAPYPKEDDALRALRCAIAIRAEWQKAMNRRPLEERCDLQIGCHSGPALVGTVGSEARLDYTAVGETVNLAVWIAQYAEPGQVLASRPVVDTAGGRFDISPLGERAVGKDGRKVWLASLLDEDEGHMVTEQLRRSF